MMLDSLTFRGGCDPLEQGREKRVPGSRPDLRQINDLEPAGERLTRMRAMRRVVAGRDVFVWASDILEELESLWTKPLHYASGVAQNVPV